jgi:hypothetical protein
LNANLLPCSRGPKVLPFLSDGHFLVFHVAISQQQGKTGKNVMNSGELRSFAPALPSVA